MYWSCSTLTATARLSLMSPAGLYCRRDCGGPARGNSARKSSAHEALLCKWLGDQTNPWGSRKPHDVAVGGHDVATDAIVRIDRKHEAQGSDSMAAQTGQPPALREALAHQAEATALQVAQPAVNQLRRSR